MAIKGPWTSAFFKWGGVDLSDHLVSLTFAETAEVGDITAHGNTTRTGKGGLKAWALTATFQQDFAAGSVQATFQGAAGNSTSVAFRQSTAAAGAANEQMTGTGVLESYTGFQGDVGETLIAEISVVSGSAIVASTST